MNGKSQNYGCRTKIPEYLQPLPPIKFDVFRKYRMNYTSPKSLLVLCCNILDNIGVGDESTIAEWPILGKLLEVPSYVMTDSYRSLCHIENPESATKYVLQRAQSKNQSTCAFLRMIKIIRDETTQQVRFNELQNHWNRIPPRRPLCPWVAIGK